MPARGAFADAVVRRHVSLLRFDKGLRKRVLAAIDSSERSIVQLIRERLDAIGSGGKTATDRQLAQLDAMLREVRDMRATAMGKATKLASGELRDATQDEAQFVASAFDAAVQIAEVKLSVPSKARLRAATFDTPYGGRRFEEWFSGLADGDGQRVTDAVRTGYLQGESTDQIVRRVRGTPKLGGTDGATQITRNQAETLVRTSVNHFANQAREETFIDNSDVIEALVWASVLDGRTSPICASRDGRYTNVPGKDLPESYADKPRLDPPDARPPAHPNCRSVLVPVIDGGGLLGNRPFVTDTRRRGEREVDFRKIAKEEGKTIKQVRSEWADERVGQVPAKTTYAEWFGRQDEQFQDDVLGATKGKLYRDGGLTLDKFVDHSGHAYTLDELRSLHPKAFEAAGSGG